MNDLLTRVRALGEPPPPVSEEEIAAMSDPRTCRTMRCQRIFDLSVEGAQSYGGSYYCGRCKDRYLQVAADTGRLHYRTHLQNAVGGIRIFNTTGYSECVCCRLYTNEVQMLGPRPHCSDCYKIEKRIKMKCASVNVLDFCGMQKPESDGLLLGVEWELDGFLDDREDAIDDIVNAIGEDFCIAKSDGSLDHGAEFVTAPAGKDFLLKRLLSGFEALEHIDIEDNEKAESGIHIHIARSFFPDTESSEKFISFINNRDNESIIRKIANRYDSRWAHILSSFPMADKPWQAAMESEGKYASVNCCHSKTFEVRLFHSTTKFKVMAARVEFVVAVARMSVLPETPLEASTEYFLNFLRERKSDYPYLCSHLRVK